MKFVPSFTSLQRPSKTFAQQVQPERFVRYNSIPNNRSEVPAPPLGFAYVPDEIANLGCYISGAPGNGKSCLIQHMALRDIRAGFGVCVIDPTGDLIKTLAEWIPRNRVDDTILFDTSNPIPVDFFSYRNPDERQILTDQLVAIFNLDDAPVSKPRLGRIIGTLFDANDNGADCTFLDIERFIEYPNRRQAILNFAPHRKMQWPEEKFKKQSDYTSIVERISRFSESPTLRKIFDAPKPKPGAGWELLNIWNVMQKGKILLINLKDTPTDFFVGSLICAKFQQATFSRREIPESERMPYYLYIDECHTILKYAAPEFEAILTRARKYNLCLTLANQLADDLPKEIFKKLPLIRTHVSLVGRFQATCNLGGYDPLTLAITPQFLGRNRENFVSEIREHTLRAYQPLSAESAQSSQKRPVDDDPCNTQDIPHTEGNGDTDPKAEQTESGEPTPPHARQGKKPRTPR